MKRSRAVNIGKWSSALLILVACASAQAAINVQMQVNATDTKLEITTQGSCTSGANPNGCVKAQGTQPINFVLVGEKRCSTGQNWALSYVALGMSEGSVGELTDVAASDFNANKENGMVTPANQSPSNIQIRNNNTAAYDVWYTVYAICGTDVIDTDPRIENDGGGRP